jgi:meckelin
VPGNGSLGVYGAPLGCACPRGSFAPSAGAASCAACPPGHAARRDGLGCLPCGNSTAGLDPATLECSCALANATAFAALTETTAGGALLPAKECVPCAAGTRAFPAGAAGGVRPASAYACQSCGDANAVMSAAGLCSCATGYVAASVAPLADGGVRCVLPADVAAAFGGLASAAGVLPASAFTVNFFSVQSAAGAAPSGAVAGVPSLAFLRLLIAAGVGCRQYGAGGDPVPCQALANLCVLQMYDASTAACAALAATALARGVAGSGTGSAGSAVHGIVGWLPTLPLLQWSWPLATARAALDQQLARNMQFKPGTPAGVQSNAAVALSFYLASYSLEGTFLGLERLRGQLAYCGDGGNGNDAGNAAADPAWARYGRGFAATYTCDVRVLAGAGPPVFYELYVRDLAADQAAADAAEAPGLSKLPMTLMPVPVRITNLRAADGSRPNVNARWTDEDNDVLVGRFVLFDTASGAAATGAGGAAAAPPVVVRYAAKISLLVQSQPNVATRVGMPLLTVTYHERASAAALAGGAMAQDSLAFGVAYTSDATGYAASMISLAVAMGVLAALWALVRLVAWMRANARTQFEAIVDYGKLARLVLFGVDAFAAFFFWFLFIATAYWLCYFKLADSTYALLPVDAREYADNAYTYFTTALWLVWVAYAARVLHALFRQCSANVFFLDWETSRGALVRVGADFEAGAGRPGGGAALEAKGAAPSQRPHTPSGGGGAALSSMGGAKMAPVSAWRTLFAANEWLALSVSRRTDVALTLVVVVALLEGGGLKFAASPVPQDLTPFAGPLNPALQYANAVFWFIVAALLQLLYHALLGERYVSEHATTRFLDLCTVMKVSVLALDARYHGFYLHGNAPHEHADGSMQDISSYLFEEAAATRVGRSLPGCPDALCQAFELHVPKLWREQFDRAVRDAGGAGVGASGMPRDAYGGGGGGGGGGYGGDGYGGGGGGGYGGGYGGGPDAQQAGGLGLSQLQRQLARQQALAGSRAALSGFLKDFVDESSPSLKRAWRERTVFESVLDLPPDLLSESAMAAASGVSPNTASFYMDQSFRFERLVFKGIELDLWCFEAVTFGLVQYYQGAAVAAFVTFALSKALAYARRHYGQRQLAQTAMLDARFLFAS